METLLTGKRIAIHLTDSVAQLRLTLHMALDAHDVLQLSSTLVNDGPDVLDVQWLAAGTVPLPGRNSSTGDSAHSRTSIACPLSFT